MCYKVREFAKLVKTRCSPVSERHSRMRVRFSSSWSTCPEAIFIIISEENSTFLLKMSSGCSWLKLSWALRYCMRRALSTES